MPIYAYRCTACGHAQDVLQKISDDVLTVCPACGAASYVKQVTAAGFQLKGSGWYVTDFRGGQTAGKEAPADAAGEGTKDAAQAATADKAKDSGKDSGKDSAKGAPTAADKTPVAAPAPAAAAPAPAAPAPAAPKAGA